MMWQNKFDIPQRVEENCHIEKCYSSYSKCWNFYGETFCNFAPFFTFFLDASLKKVARYRYLHTQWFYFSYNIKNIRTYFYSISIPSPNGTVVTCTN